MYGTKILVFRFSEILFELWELSLTTLLQIVYVRPLIQLSTSVLWAMTEPFS